jgi:LPXTG-motif cell wall-anchored protein
VRGVRALVGGYALLVALVAPTALLADESERPAVSGGAVIAPTAAPTAAGDGDASASTSGSKQATHDVAMRDIKFVPREITVDVGDTVTWTNEDSVDHNAIADDDSFRTPTFGEGESASVTIDQAGSFPYFCSLHANMEGRISTTGSEPSEDGGGSGGGGSGGGSGSSSGDDPLIPGASGSGTSSGAGTGTDSSSGTSGDGSLPQTGADSVWLAVAGAWLLAVGAAVRAAVAGRI